MDLKTGNMALVKALTGHKTDSQVSRYVTVTVATSLQKTCLPIRAEVAGVNRWSSYISGMRPFNAPTQIRTPSSAASALLRCRRR